MFRFSWHGRAIYRQDFPTPHILAGGLLILFLFPADDGHSTAIAPALGLLAGRSQANRQPYRPAYPCRNLQISAFPTAAYTSTQSSSPSHITAHENNRQYADNCHGSTRHPSRASDYFVPCLPDCHSHSHCHRGLLMELATGRLSFS